MVITCYNYHKPKRETVYLKAKLAIMGAPNFASSPAAQRMSQPTATILAQRRRHRRSLVDWRWASLK